MKDISLIDAFNYLRLCEGVILEGRVLDISLIGIEEDPNNEFAYISWVEEIRGEYVDFEIVFKEGDNQEVMIDGSFMTLVNTEGVLEEIQLLIPWNIESHLLGND